MYMDWVYRDLRCKAMEKHGGRCIRCGFSDWRALQFDHIDGNGRTDRKGVSSIAYMKRILTDSDGYYQLLCANCNTIKRYEDKENVNQKSNNDILARMSKFEGNKISVSLC